MDTQNVITPQVREDARRALESAGRTAGAALSAFREAAAQVTLPQLPTLKVPRD